MLASPHTCVRFLKTLLELHFPHDSSSKWWTFLRTYSRCAPVTLNTPWRDPPKTSKCQECWRQRCRNHRSSKSYFPITTLNILLFHVLFAFHESTSQNFPVWKTTIMPAQRIPPSQLVTKFFTDFPIVPSVPTFIGPVTIFFTGFKTFPTVAQPVTMFITLVWFVPTFPSFIQPLTVLVTNFSTYQRLLKPSSWIFQLFQLNPSCCSWWFSLQESIHEEIPDLWLVDNFATSWATHCELHEFQLVAQCLICGLPRPQSIRL